MNDLMAEALGLEVLTVEQAAARIADQMARKEGLTTDKRDAIEQSMLSILSRARPGVDEGWTRKTQTLN